MGVLYIAGTVAGALSLAVTDGGIDGPDYLASAASLGDSLAVGGLLLMVMGLSLACIPLLAFPILRRTSERLAVGFVVFRGALKTSTTLLVALSWFVLFQLGEDVVAVTVGAADAKALIATGEAVYRLGDTAGTLGTFVFVMSAAMFYAVLVRARLVPRWLSVWGLIALVPYLVVAVLGVLGNSRPALEHSSGHAGPVGAAGDGPRPVADYPRLQPYDVLGAPAEPSQQRFVASSRDGQAAVGPAGHRRGGHGSCGGRGDAPVLR